MDTNEQNLSQELDLEALEPTSDPVRVLGWSIVSLKNKEEFGCHLMEQELAGTRFLRAELSKSDGTKLGVQYHRGEGIKRIILVEESVAKSRNDRLKITRNYGGSDVQD